MASLMQAAPVAVSLAISGREAAFPPSVFSQELRIRSKRCRRCASFSSAASVAAAGAFAKKQFARRRYRRHAVAMNALNPMAELLARHVPMLNEVADVQQSMEGDGLGLFAKKKFEEDDTICEIPIDSELIMRPKDVLSQKLEARDWGALAFQVLKAYRGEKPSPWKDWVEAGAKAPDTHPLKLLLTDPELVKRLWSSTTCGGRMSASALQVRDDMEQLSEGGATLEEWTDFLALVQSRTVFEDGKGRPILVMGPDLMQAARYPVVRIEPVVQKENNGFFGLGASGDSRVVALRLVAELDIEVGDELTLRYMQSPQPGRYLEQYGFVPRFFEDEDAEVAVELSFAAIEPEDDNAPVKESHLEDLEISTAPLRFLFSSRRGGILPPVDSDDWDEKGDLNRMVHVLRFQTCGGPDAFLCDSVFINQLWPTCQYRISKTNEILVCQTVMDEVDRWLARFDTLEEAGPEPEDKVSKSAACVRQRERKVLVRLKECFEQEQIFTNLETQRIYWVDRQMDVVFPERKIKDDRMWTN
mmetsp:Transcript_70916/g.125325  ORF Transcript_70916/g.125325 Transcript_70916/m.125325 type:complete len:530 (-) Transcript_70916:35-1624(-)